jgi:hypothetical protein
MKAIVCFAVLLVPATAPGHPSEPVWMVLSGATLIALGSLVRRLTS